jgi:polyisoprenoid-binding protein YceI
VTARCRSALLGLCAILVAAPLAASAGDLVVTVDPAATKTTFVLRATLHKAEGRVPLTSGEIRFDPATGRASGKIVFDATKATTDNDGRDEKMHKEVLESAKYPEFVFVPEKVDGPFNNTGVSKLKLIGTITIHGGSHPLTVPLDVQASGARVTVKGTFQIPYVAWGMKDPSFFVVRAAKEVDVTLESAGSVAPAP